MGEVTVGNTNMVDPVEWEKLTQEGEGGKSKHKVFEESRERLSSIQWMCQQETRQTVQGTKASRW